MSCLTSNRASNTFGFTATYPGVSRLRMFVDFRLKGTYHTYVEALHWSIHDPNFIYIV